MVFGTHRNHHPDHANHHRRAEQAAQNCEHRQTEDDGHYHERYGETSPRQMRAVSH